MYITQNFMIRIERMYLQCRGIGIPMLVPLLVNYAILPLAIFLFAQSGDYQGAEEYAWQLSLLFFPIMSVWWVIMVLEKSLEESGELFYLYERAKWVDVMLYFLTYILFVFPLCMSFMARWPDEFYLEDFMSLSAQCFFSVCLVYLLCFMTMSVAISFVTILAFTLYAEGRLYFLFERFEMEHWISGPGYFVVGLLCLLIGITFQKSNR